MRKPLRLAAVVVVPVAFAATLVACGSSTSTPTASSSGAASTAVPTAAPTAAAPTDTPTPALSSLTCPSVDTVNSGLGLTVAAPISVPAEDLPAGSTGIVCTYSDTATQQAVVIDVATLADATSFIAHVEAGEQQAAQAQGNTFTATTATTGSGGGLQAAIVAVSSAGGPIENGIVAVSGNTGLVITAMPPLDQSQLGAFASQLLG